MYAGGQRSSAVGVTLNQPQHLSPVDFGSPVRRRGAFAVVAFLVAALMQTFAVSSSSAADSSGAQPAAWSSTVNIGTGLVSTLAGSGTSAVADGSGSAASFGRAYGMSVVGDFGYVLDNAYIRKVSLSTGVVSTVAGNGLAACVDSPNPSAAEVGTLGAPVNDGTYLYWTDSACASYTDYGELRRMSLATGAISAMPGPVYAEYVTVGPAGQLYVASGSNISTVDSTTGATTVLATLPSHKYIYDDGQSIRGLAADGTSIYTTASMYDCDCTVSGYTATSKIDIATGTVTSLYTQPYGTTAGYIVGQLVSAGTYLYIADSSKVWRMSKTDGSYSSIAGASYGFHEGTGAQAWFAGLNGIDTDGTNLWVDDSANYRIRKIAVGTPLSATQPAAWS